MENQENNKLVDTNTRRKNMILLAMLIMLVALLFGLSFVRFGQALGA